jgi:hypothetical protein
MLLAPGATCNGGLAAEELHVLPTLAQRPAAAVRAQIAEPDVLCILIHHVRLFRALLWKSPTREVDVRPAMKGRSRLDRVADPVRTETGPDRGDARPSPQGHDPGLKGCEMPDVGITPLVVLVG